MSVISSIKRSKIMAAIHSKDTKPEMIVRKWLWKRGFRYRLNAPRLPGHPDLVLKKYRTCIFVNGCFWHGHENCNQFRKPKTNIDFWENKIKRNQQRDKDEIHKLSTMGWHTITVWECELRPKTLEKTLTSLAYTLNHIFILDHSKENYEAKEEKMLVAAEEREKYGIK